MCCSTAGIQSELRNQYLAGALGDLPMLETWPQLYVDDADEQARCAPGAGHDRGGSAWTCEECGERSSRNSPVACGQRNAGDSRIGKPQLPSRRCELAHCSIKLSRVGQTLTEIRANSEARFSACPWRRQPCTGYKSSPCSV